MWMLMLLGILMFVFANGLSTWSLSYIPVGLSSLIGALYPLCVVLIETLVFKKKSATLLTFTGMLVGIFGVGIVFSESAFAQHKNGFLGGLLLSVIAMLGWSLATIVISRNKIGLNPYYALGWQMLFGAAFLYLSALLTGQHMPIAQITARGWYAILFLVGAGSIIAFVAFIYSVKSLPVAISSLYAYFNPLVAMVVAFFWAGENLSAVMIWGAVVTMLGVFIVNYSIKRNDKNVVEEKEAEEKI